MEINDYLDPVSLQKPAVVYLNNKSTFCSAIDINTPSTPVEGLNDYAVAILGVPEGRNSVNENTNNAPEVIRNKLYQLAKPKYNIPVIDLGDLKISGALNNTLMGLRDVLIELMDRKIIVVIIGGGQNLTYSSYLLYKYMNEKLNLITVDAKLDLYSGIKDIHSDNYVRTIINKDKKENLLFSYTNLGHQTYFIDKKEINFLNKRFYDSFRLGVVRSRLEQTEPFIRDSNVMSIDVNVVRQSDAPANKRPSVNGFYGEELCAISRYAGLSDAMSVFGVYELNPAYDSNDQTAHLYAQAVWYFIDGVIDRKKQEKQKNNHKKFIVHLKNSEHHEIIFYQSSEGDKWWLEVPSIKEERNIIVSCSYDDYLQACDDEIPDIWWKTYQKIN